MPASKPTSVFRGRALLGILVAVTAAALSGGTGSARAASDAEALTLRLSDLAPGYLVGDDGGCGLGFADEHAPRVLVELERRYRHEACQIQFERLWVPPGEPPGAQLVESAAVEFRGEAGAVAGFAAARALIAYTLGLPRESLERRPAAIEIGDSVAVFRRGGRPATAVLWRTGRVLSLVLVTGAAGEQRALGLAQLQQSRIEVPTPLSPGDNDDRQVPLDNPQLGVPVYWLGPRLRPRGGLPALVLEESFGPLGRHNGPGWRADVDYRTAGRGAGVKLGLWRPRAFARFRRTRLGRLVRAQRCARAERVDLRDGRAVIHAGYSTPPRRCGRQRPDRYLAHVFLDGVVVTINIPHCFRCLEPGHRNPYDTLAGMRAVIEALQLRP